MFDRAKKMFELQKQARELRKQLQAHTYSAESSSGAIKVTANGEQELVSVAIDLNETYQKDPNRLAKDVLDVVNKALEKSKKGSAELMRSLVGDMGLPGM